MNFITNIIILFMGLTTVVKATPSSFTFNGDRTVAPDGSCKTWWLYYTVTDTSDEDSTGYFEVDDCLNGTETLGDGTYTLYLDLDVATAILTEYATGIEVHGHSYNFDEGLELICDLFACEPDSEYPSSTMTCFYGGGGPDVPDYNYPKGHCTGKHQWR